MPEAALLRPGSLGVPRYRRLLGVATERWIQVFGLGLVGLLVIAPIIPIIYQSLIDRPLYESGAALTLENYAELFRDAGFGQVVVNTALFAALTTAFTLIIAIPLAIVLVRTRLPGAWLFGSALKWPFFISSLILGFGWLTMYGPAGFISVWVRQTIGFVPWDLYTIPGMALVEAVALTPIVYLFCANALLQTDASLESAARVAGAGPFRILRSIVLPLLRPPILYSCILTVSISLETLSIPLLFGGPVDIDVFSTFLFRRGLQSIRPDYGILAAASVIILATTVLLVVVQARLLRNSQRFVSVRGKATRPRPFDFGWLRWIAVASVAFYVVFGALIPLGGLVLRSFTKVFTPLRNPFDSLTLENYGTIFGYETYVRSIQNSLIVAGLGALLVSAVAVLAVMIARRSTFRLGRTVESLALLPQAMPGLIVGIGFFWAFALAPLGLGGLIQGTLFAIIIGFGIRALPSAFGSVAPVTMQIAGELDAAARVAGADWLRTFRRILARLIAPAFGGALILVFVTMMKEYTPAVFLGTASTNVIGTTMLELWIQGTTDAVAALATIQIFITAAVVGIAGRLFRGHADAREHADA